VIVFKNRTSQEAHIYHKGENGTLIVPAGTEVDLTTWLPAVQLAFTNLPALISEGPSRYCLSDGVDDYSSRRALLLLAYPLDPPAKTKICVSSRLVHLEVAITETTKWQELGGAILDPDFFSSRADQCRGRVSGEYKSVGAGATLRLYEDGVGAGNFTLEDTAGVWTKMRWNTGAVTAGVHSYLINGRLNSAASASIRFCDITLVEIL
jgi:hypothetical protein